MPPCCRPPRRARLLLFALALLLLALAAALAPRVARAVEREEQELVAEAAFVADTLPPGGRDLVASLGATSGDPGLSPRVQLAIGAGPRLGFTVDVGVAPARGGLALEAPAASVKLLLRAPGFDRTGVSLSLDLFGGPTFAQSEAGLGVGLVRGVGPLTVRTALWGASPVGAFAPHAHAGASAALAAGSRVHLLAETVADLDGDAPAVAAGPTVKVQVAEAISFSASALLGMTAAADDAAVLFQLAHSL